MSVTLAIAWNTFLEAIRERALYLLAGFAGFIFVASRILSPLALGEGRRVTIDLGMMALSVFGLLIIVFVGHSLVYREIERGTVAFLFSRPVGRGQFVAGKFLGLALVLLNAVVAMGLVLALVLLLSRYPFGTELVGALFLSLLELWILAAIALLCAALASPMLAGLFVVGAWLVGNSVGAISDFAVLYPGEGVTFLAGIAGWVLPRLDLYDGARWLVHGQGPPAGQWYWSLAYAALYIVAMLLLARARFARRQLVG
jgi:ABC-type transport system involved in multi-copper enzyme maturation permease subunit